MRRQPLCLPILPQVRQKTPQGRHKAYGDPLRHGEEAPASHIPRRKRSARSNDPWQNWDKAGDDEGSGTYWKPVQKDLMALCLEAAGGPEGGHKGGVKTDGQSRNLRMQLLDYTGLANSVRERAERDLAGARPQEAIPEARGCKATGGMEGGNQLFKSNAPVGFGMPRARKTLQAAPAN